MYNPNKTNNVKIGVTHEDMVSRYHEGNYPIDFIGGIEITAEESLSLVPKSFPNSSKLVYEEYEDTEMYFDEKTMEEKTRPIIKNRVKVDEDGDNVTEQKNWIEYSGVRGKLRDSINDKKILEVGYRNHNSNKSRVDENTFKRFADHFGIENIMTKSEMENIDRNLVLSNYPVETETIKNNLTSEELRELIRQIESDSGIDIKIPSGTDKEGIILIILKSLGRDDGI